MAVAPGVGTFGFAVADQVEDLDHLSVRTAWS